MWGRFRNGSSWKLYFWWKSRPKHWRTIWKTAAAGCLMLMLLCHGVFAESGVLLCWSWELCWPPLIPLKMACLRLKMQSTYFHKQTSEKCSFQYCTHHSPCGEKGVKLSKMSLSGWKITGCFCLELCSLTETFRLLFLTALLSIRDMFSNPGRPSAEPRTAVCV